MKIVIDIPEEIRNDILADGVLYVDYVPVLRDAIKNGTPLNEVLDKIRAEIDEQIKYNTYFNSDMAKGEIIAFEWVKRKIDKHTKGDTNEDKKE